VSAAKENPHEHLSSPFGCHPDCEACAWEENQQKKKRDKETGAYIPGGINEFTIVALCLCGCDDSRIFHARAKTVAGAVKSAKKQAKNDSIRIISVFDGKLGDVSSEEQRMAHLAGV
jgi:hypothetical protein